MSPRMIALPIAVLLLACRPVVAGENDKYLPAGTGILLRIDVQGLLEAPSLKNDKDALQRAQKMIDGLLADYDSVRKHMTAAGIDIYRDVTTITTAMPNDGDPDKAFVIMEGRFDPAQFRKAAEAAAAKPEEGVKLLKIGAQDAVQLALPGRDEPIYACLVDQGTLLGAGNKDQLAGALKQTAVGKDVQALLPLLDAKQHVSFAGTRAAMVKLLDHTNVPFGDALGPILEGADTLRGGLVLGTECEVLLRFGTKDEKSAKQFFQQTTLVLAAARGVIAKMAKEDASYVPVQELMKGLRTSMDGNTVVWRSQVSLATAEKLLKSLTK